MSLVLLLNLSGGVGAQGRDIDGHVGVLIAYFFLMLPYSLAGGALEAVYGARTRAVPCCFFVILGVAAGIVFPVLLVSELGLFSSTVGMWTLVGAGAVAHMGAAAAAWAVVRQSSAVQALRGRTASG
ncbi:MAG: hypothetical protein KKA32_01045 [Actinobacteria bacterium]|nr:hypothetical protein [Actinomycetota bacterium]